MDYTIWFSGQRFGWDLVKAASNIAKHGVSFEEAMTVFLDENAKLIDDPDHSIEESRTIALGTSGSGRILVVSFVERVDRLRLISARPGKASERQRYVHDGQ